MTKEDWTLVTDRSQKKRIQNRVAQRTYRNRIKQRVEELEKEVSEYRRRAQEHDNVSGDSQEGGAVGNGSHSRNHTQNSNGNHPTDQNTTMGAGNSTASGKMKSNSSGGGKANDELSTSSTSSYEVDMDTTDGELRRGRDGAHEGPPTTLMPQNDAVVQPQCLSQSAHTRPQMPAQLAFSAFPSFASPPLTQPYNLAADWPWPNAPNTVYRDSLGQQPLAGFSSLGTTRPGRSEQETGSDTSYHISSDATYIVQPGAQEQSHIPTPDGTMDLRTASSSRSPDPGSISAISPRSPANLVAGVSGADIGESSANLLETCSSGDLQMRHRCIEDRFEYIRQCTANAGFCNFDATVGQYYTTDFSHESIISHEQRKSRHSELPLFLSQLRNNVETWTQWEAHGYQYEIIKSAERIVRAERGVLADSREIFRDALSDIEKLSPGITATDSRGGTSISRAFRPLAKKLQDSAPKLWALTESLVGSDETVNQRQRSYTSLAIMLLLCCSDQASKSQMTALVTSCLDIAYENQR